MNWKTIYYTVLFSLFLACAKDDDTPPGPITHPIEDTIFGRLANNDKPIFTTSEFYSDIKYGDDDREILDFFKAENAKATIIAIHGGSFIRNNKEVSYEFPYGTLLSSLTTDYNIVNISYQLLDTLGNETQGVIRSLQSIERAIDFVEENADVFGDDIVLAGVSAGAGASLWYGLDNAKNSKIKGIVALEAAGTYNLPVWETYIPGLSIEDLLISDPEAAALFRTFTAGNTLDFDSVDYCDYLDITDPPIFIANTGGEGLLGLLHHEAHAEFLRAKADEAGAIHTTGPLTGLTAFINSLFIQI